MSRFTDKFNKIDGTLPLRQKDKPSSVQESQEPVKSPELPTQKPTSDRGRAFTIDETKLRQPPTPSRIATFKAGHFFFHALRNWFWFGNKQNKSAAQHISPRSSPAHSSSGDAATDSFVEHMLRQVEPNWLFQKIVETGEAFLTYARQNGLITYQPNAILAMVIRPDIEALLLGYKLVSAAYRLRQKNQESDILRDIHLTMINNVFLKAAKDDFQREIRDDMVLYGKKVDDSFPLSLRQATIKYAQSCLQSADSDIAAAIANLHARSPSPFSPFYDGLTPAFGGKGSSEELERRYSAILQEFFFKLDRVMSERRGLATD